jgi:hypothetical protein
MYMLSLARVADEGITPQSGTLQADYFYLCLRKLRIVRLSEAHDLLGITTLLGYAARTLFNLRARQESRPRGRPSDAQARAWICYDQMASDSAGGFLLGSAGDGMLDSHSLLGNSAMEVTSVLGIEIMIRLAEWEMLVGQGMALIHFMAVCDLAIPLNMNYRIHFAVDPEDWSFKLASDRETAGAGLGGQAVLGINSALGRA